MTDQQKDLIRSAEHRVRRVAAHLDLAARALPPEGFPYDAPAPTGAFLEAEAELATARNALRRLLADPFSSTGTRPS